MQRFLATGLAAAFALCAAAAHAQATSERPAQTSPDATGRTPAAVERAENSRPAKATKRAAKKGGNVAKRAGHRTADAMRSTGGAIEQRLPRGGSNNTGNTSEAGAGAAPAR